MTRHPHVQLSAAQALLIAAWLRRITPRGSDEAEMIDSAVQQLEQRDTP